jgi:predicted phosphodiesterase
MRSAINTAPGFFAQPKVQDISKEKIKDLHFPKSEVLINKFEQLMRAKDLDQAISLGNICHAKVSIHFEDIEGRKKVTTTIWGLTDTHVILKGHISIPVNRIISIHF